VKKSRVLIADDHPLILEGFRALLAAEELEVAGTFLDGRALVEGALKLKPDLIVLDIAMPFVNGIEAARQIRKALPKVRFLFVTMQTNPAYLTEAMASGASAFVLKTSAREELLKAVRMALRGTLHLGSCFGGVLKDLGRRGRRATGLKSALTYRQREILKLVAEGQTAKEMAAALNISVQTIAFRKTQIMNKLGIRTTAELTRYAIREGLVHP
jgi:DNA-binding NarL/FixJ family response regulator